MLVAATVTPLLDVAGLRLGRFHLHWAEIPGCEPDDFTMDTMPARFAEIGDLHADIDDHPFDIAPLLEWADRDEAAGEQAPAEPEGD